MNWSRPVEINTIFFFIIQENWIYINAEFNKITKQSRELHFACILYRLANCIFNVTDFIDFLNHGYFETKNHIIVTVLSYYAYIL